MLSTLSTLFRAAGAEAEEALSDQTAATLLAQHLRDARADLTARKAATARLMAQEADLTRRTADHAARITRREDEARKALAAGDPALAEDIAADIMRLEERQAQTADDIRTLSARIGAARKGLDEAEERFADLTDQLRRSREGALTRRAARPGAGPARDPLSRAAEAAEILRARDTQRADMDAAYDRLSMSAPGEALDAWITASGITDNSAARRAAILKRIKGDDK